MIELTEVTPTLVMENLDQRGFCQVLWECGGGELKIIAAILERPVIEKILTHLGLDPQPPPRGRAREVVQD